MRSSYVFVLAAVVAFAGCSRNGGSPLAPTGQIGDLPSLASTQHRNSAPSWMAPDASTSILLYVTDFSTQDVDVYSYPDGTLKGKLTGFSRPHGMCVDKAGNVFIVNALAADILEYAHGGTHPIRTLDDSGYFPESCAVDPRTGNLAVTNTSPMGPGPGGISMYAHAQGTRTLLFAKSGLFAYYYDTYDDKGNLYVDGLDMSYNIFEFAKIAFGTRDFTNITLDYRVHRPGGVVWDGKYVAIGDQVALNGPSPIYEFSIQGNIGKGVGATALTGSCDVLQFWLVGGTLIGPNDCNSSVKVWPYPAGGDPIKSIRVAQPIAVVLSGSAIAQPVVTGRQW